MIFNDAELIVAGAGLAGLTQSLALAEEGLQIALVDGVPQEIMHKNEFDGRTSALSYASVNYYKKLGIWSKIADQAAAIKEIRITDEDSPLFLHFGLDDVKSAMQKQTPMGYIVENRHLRAALLDVIDKHKNIKTFIPARFKNIQQNTNNITLELENKFDGIKSIQGKLIIAADGKNSYIRNMLNITKKTVDYKQSAATFSVWHEHPHNNVAIEKFTTGGPFAILPLAYDGKKKADSGHYSSIVWTDSTEKITAFLKAEDDLFERIFQKVFGQHWGDTKIISKPAAYPLSLVVSNNYTAKRACLVGDAAHAIHPISGQGLNLSIRDIAVVTENVKKTKMLGLDIGSDVWMADYERLRHGDNMQMIAATHILNRLFSNNILPLKIARRVGLAAVNKMPKLRRKFIKHAMGISPDTPKAMEG